MPKRLTAAVLLALGLYGIGLAPGNAQGACAAAKARTAAMDPLARGEVAALLVAKEPKPLPDLDFLGQDGKPTKLSALRGKTVLLNLWATWCAPCRKEMPALDRLQAELDTLNDGTPAERAKAAARIKLLEKQLDQLEVRVWRCVRVLPRRPARLF